MPSCELDYIGNPQQVGERSEQEVGYVLNDYDSSDAALRDLIATAPPRLGGLIKINHSISGVTSRDFNGTVTYGTKDPTESTYSFEISVANTKITQSLETVGAYARPGRYPSNCGGAIGVTKDGVEGTEISVPEFKFNETHFLPPSQMTRWYFFTLFNCVAKMNGDYFRGFDPGEVLLIGVNGSKSQSQPSWEMQFSFLCLPNSGGGSINDIAIGEKLGHDYLWVRYLEEKDNSSNALVKIPYEVFIERVYEFTAMSDLRLPDPF